MLGTFWKSLRARSIQLVVHEKPLNLDPYPPTTVSLFTKPPRPFRSAITTRMRPPPDRSPHKNSDRQTKHRPQSDGLVSATIGRTSPAHGPRPLRQPGQCH